MFDFLDFLNNFLTIIDSENYKKENNKSWKITISMIFSTLIFIFLISRKKIFFVENNLLLIIITLILSILFSILIIYILFKIKVLRELTINQFIVHLITTILFSTAIILEINYNYKIII